MKRRIACLLMVCVIAAGCTKKEALTPEQMEKKKALLAELKTKIPAEAGQDKSVVVEGDNVTMNATMPMASTSISPAQFEKAKAEMKETQTKEQAGYCREFKEETALGISFIFNILTSDHKVFQTIKIDKQICAALPPAPPEEGAPAPAPEPVSAPAPAPGK
ncbi:hypothetical protein LPW11_04005 [Geomonas sp. RF6]|uniref:hypothetical protein n=1 Tax=Geomonas sp. RF6 TaxID=2897342 RepID=UPI001E5F40B6|nr:hypothetical protein [Geomonas sp. RF6]UFS71362.1 hypothetical protein LPW11_04005 [Geomonas sp. RF6]